MTVKGRSVSLYNDGTCGVINESRCLASGDETCQDDCGESQDISAAMFSPIQLMTYVG